jgi:hypothetical protein
MILKWFIKNEWRESRRAAMWEQSLGIKIFLGFVFLIIFAEMMLGSIMLGKNFHEIFPEDDAVQKFNGFVLYGFALGFVVRLFMQKVPVLGIQPYLHLPVPKASLVNYVLGKSIFASFNFFPILVFTPFIDFQMGYNYSAYQITAYVLFILFTVYSINFLALLFKRNLSGSNFITLAVIAIVAMLGFAEYFGLISITSISSIIFTSPLQNPVFLVFPLIVVLAAYLLNYHDLSRHLYPEDNLKLKKSTRRNVSDFSYLRNFGETGNLMILELKLMIRNKRPKSTVVFVPIFLLYGLIFYPNPELYGQNGWLIFVGIFMTGGITLIYGQYLLSWESSYFDGILSHIDDFHLYFKAKHNLLVFSTLLSFVLTLPYAWFGTKILLINFIAALFNMGVSSVFVIWMSTNNKKRLDLSKGAAFNYQGVSASQFLVSFPIMLAPLLIYLPFWAFGYYDSGLYAIGIVSLLALIFNRALLKIAVNRFMERRYLIGEGFRKK